MCLLIIIEFSWSPSGCRCILLCRQPEGNVIWNKDNFIASAATWMSSVSLLYLVVLSKTGRPRWVEEAGVRSSASSVILGRKSDLGYKIWVDPLIRLIGSHLLCWFVYHECMLNFLNAFSVSYWDGRVGFVPYSINLAHYINWVLDANPAFRSWDKSHLVAVCNPFYMLLNSLP